MFANIAQASNLNTANQSNSNVRPISNTWYISIAAAALALICFAFLLLQQKSSKETPLAYTRIINNTKHITHKILSDGSTVWLSPNASLDYPAVFNATSRNVRMTGECFFEVTKNPKSPFIITGRHIVTKVWGTSFKVTDYNNALTAKVIVVTGKVSVAKKNTSEAAQATLGADEVMLHPAEEVSYDAAKNSLTENKNADMATVAIWKRVDLNFNKTSLAAIVKVLNKNFQSNIVINDARLSQAVMNADLNDLNLPEVLEVLKTSMNLNYAITPNQIVLSKTN